VLYVHCVSLKIHSGSVLVFAKLMAHGVPFYSAAFQGSRLEDAAKSQLRGNPSKLCCQQDHAQPQVKPPSSGAVYTLMQKDLSRDRLVTNVRDAEAGAIRLTSPHDSPTASYRRPCHSENSEQKFGLRKTRANTSTRPLCRHSAPTSPTCLMARRVEHRRWSTTIQSRQSAQCIRLLHGLFPAEAVPYFTRSG